MPNTVYTYKCESFQLNKAVNIAENTTDSNSTKTNAIQMHTFDSPTFFLHFFFVHLNDICNIHIYAVLLVRPCFICYVCLFLHSFRFAIFQTNNIFIWTLYTHRNPLLLQLHYYYYYFLCCVALFFLYFSFSHSASICCCCISSISLLFAAHILVNGYTLC